MSMDTLTDRQRQIVVLKCRHDLSHAEVGQRLGITEHTVKNHVSEILRSVRMGSMHGICWLDGQEWGYAKALNDLADLTAMRSDEV